MWGQDGNVFARRPDHFPRAAVLCAPQRDGPRLGVLFVVVDRDLAREGVPNSNYWWFPDFDTEAEYRRSSTGGSRPTPT